MTFKKISYGRLYGCLASLGYERKDAPTHVVYRKKGHELPIILPKMASTREVPSSNITAVEEILRLDGILEAGQAANFLYQSPLGREITSNNAPEDEISEDEAAIDEALNSIRGVVAKIKTSKNKPSEDEPLRDEASKANRK